MSMVDLKSSAHQLAHEQEVNRPGSGERQHHIGPVGTVRLRSHRVLWNGQHLTMSAA